RRVLLVDPQTMHIAQDADDLYQLGAGKSGEVHHADELPVAESLNYRAHNKNLRARSLRANFSGRDPNHRYAELRTDSIVPQAVDKVDVSPGVGEISSQIV